MIANLKRGLTDSKVQSKQASLLPACSWSELLIKFL